MEELLDEIRKIIVSYTLNNSKDKDNETEDFYDIIEKISDILKEKLPIDFSDIQNEEEIYAEVNASSWWNTEKVVVENRIYEWRNKNYDVIFKGTIDEIVKISQKEMYLYIHDGFCCHGDDTYTLTTVKRENGKEKKYFY
mgnify:CR=1 FL=1